MQEVWFPPVFIEQLNNETNDKIKVCTRNFNSNCNVINQNRAKKPDLFDYAFSAFCVGGLLGFFGCSFVCISDMDNFGWSLLTWIAVIAISEVVALVIYPISLHIYQANEKQLDNKLEEESIKYDGFISEIKEQADTMQKEYLSNFEKAAQNMSVQLAESELAKEVIQWMTEGFSKTIDAADRRSHIEQISVPFQFKVFVDKITCNLGTYDFELKRCRNLTSPLEQTALARAIAAAIQFNIIMKYPKDASGTDRAVNFEFSYTDTHPVATLTYAAPNGNYQAVRSW